MFFLKGGAGDCDYLEILLGPIIFSFLLIGCSDLFGVFL